MELSMALPDSAKIAIRAVTTRLIGSRERDIVSQIHLFTGPSLKDVHSRPRHVIRPTM